jgi:hypothetical protein
MKTSAKIFLVFGLLFCGSALAQTDLTGTWQGKLAIDQNNKMNIQFILTRQADGSYKAVVNSLDTGGIKNIPANAVKLAGDKLTIDVASLSGSFAGTVSKGTITGEWRQQGSTFPLVLTPYKKPELSSLKPLLGEWVGALPPSVGKITTVFRFEMSPEGKFAAFLDVPEQNAKGIAVSDVTLEGNELHLKVPAAQIDYAGHLSGNSIDGTFKQGGAEFELDLKKGKYQAPPLDMPAEAVNMLVGQWAGRANVPGDIIYTIVLRFEKTKDGKLLAVSDCPEQGSRGTALTDVTLKGDQFSFKLPLPGLEYTGKLANNSISGTCKIRGKQYELNLTKGAKFEAQIPQVNISDEAMKKLLGRWNGKLSVISVVFRFERAPGGKNVVFIDSPEQSIKNQPALKASVVNDTLSLKTAGAEYNGKIVGNKIEGSLKPVDQEVFIPLPMTKE